MSGNRRGWMSQLKEREEIALPSLFFVLFTPTRDCMVPACTDEGRSSSDANLFQKHPHRHNQKPANYQLP